MTLYLLIATYEGEDHYSIWKTRESAKYEMIHLKEKFGISYLAMDIIVVVCND